ncbi:MAG: hypothetical protein ACE5OY_08170 [Candidatus Bathyarchaeia archaeon]
MLGQYPLFPETKLGKVILVHAGRSSVVGEAIIDALTTLPQARYEESVSIAGLGERRVLVTPEARIAMGRRFHPINKDVINRLRRRLEAPEFPTLDFHISVNFQYRREDGIRSLRSDRYLLRFSFSKKTITLEIAHRRGTMRMTAGKLITMILERINAKLEESGSRPLDIRGVKVMAWGSS